MLRFRRCLVALLVAALAVLPALAAPADYLAQLPTGDRWIAHLNNDLLPFWSLPAALGSPTGNFPSTRCDDGSALNFQHPCAIIAGNPYLMTPDQYLVPESRQTFGYGVAYHLTGNTEYLDWMKAGVQYIRQNMIDPAGGMFLNQDLTNNTWGPDRAFRDPQQLGYGVLCLAFYYYLTRDDTVLPDILALKNYILGTYYNTQLGTMQWLLQSNDGTAYNSKQLVADLDQMNTYLVLLAPILPEPSQTEWKQSLTTLSRSILGVFYSPGDNLLFTQADSPADTDLTKTGVDLGHTSKGLWMMRWTGLMTGDNGLADFATAAGRRHLTRSYVPEDGSWAGSVLPGGALDKDKNWWVYAELDQLANTLALAGDPSAGQYLPQTAAYWFQYFVDPQYGEVWNGVNYGTNTPQRDYPKAWQWKSAYHDFEHVLVGYIGAQWLHGQPVTLHYAFTRSVDPGDIHPYYFSAPIESTVSSADNQYQTVTFAAPSLLQTPSVTAASTASYLAATLAAGSMASLFGSGLAAATAQAPPGTLPQQLAGATVAVLDSAGVTRQAGLFYVSPSQINLVIPAATRPGSATFTITVGDGTTLTANTQIAPVAPGMFQMNSAALAAAEVIRVHADNSQTIESVYQVDASQGVVARPIDLGASTGSVYLTLFATGLQNAANVSVTVAGHNVPVTYSGPQGSWAGFDQVNIGPLPTSLAGSGRVNIVLAADGQTANPVDIAIQ